MEWLTSLYPAVRATMAAALPAHWPGLTFALEPLLTGPLPKESMLPLAACKAVGGDPRAAVPIAAAILAAQASLRLVDDLFDQDRPDGLWDQPDPRRAWGYATALQALAFKILAQAPLAPALLRQLNQAQSETLLLVGHGQDHDLTQPPESLADCWQAMALKTGSAYAGACLMGAIVGSVDPRLRECCRAYGHHFGLALQIWNDLEAVWEDPELRELQRGKRTLPLVYALSVDHPARGELRAQLQRAPSQQDAPRIKALLDELGVKDFLVWCALKEREQALGALSRCPDEQGKQALDACITGMFGDLAPA